MEIGPVTSVRPSQAPQFKGFDNQLPTVFEVEYLGRSADETYSSNHGNTASGQDDDFADPASLEPGESAAPRVDGFSGRQISFFA